MENKEIEQLIQSTPFDQMNPDQALQVLVYALSKEDKSKINPEFLDLSVRCRYFRKSIIMMNEGVTSTRIPELIFFLLKNPMPLEDDFSYFLLFCFSHLNDGKNRFDFSDISSHISSFSDKNVDKSIALLISYLYFFPNYNFKLFESIEFSEDYQKQFKLVIDSFSDENLVPPYVYLKSHFESMIQTFSETTYSKLSEAITAYKSDEVNNRIGELTNSLLVTVKSMSKNLKTATVGEFKDKFLNNVSKLEEFMKANLLSACRIVRLAATQASSISDKIERISSELKSVKELVIDNFLNSPSEETVNSILSEVNSDCSNFSTQPDAKLHFTSSTATFLFLTSSISLLKMYVISMKNGDDSNSNRALSKLRNMKETIENIVDRLKTDIPSYTTVIQSTLSISQSLNDKDDRTYRSVHSACDALLLWLHLSECASLDGVIREEAVLYSETSSFYPDFAANIFTKIVKKSTKEKARKAKELRDDFYQTVSLTYSSFIRNLKLIPGMRKDALYRDFVPAEKWTWPKSHGAASFPQDPETVRELLKLRSQIYEFADEYKLSMSVPLCMCCNKATACVVCPKCRKLVLCNACKEKLKKCPSENCDHVFIE